MAELPSGSLGIAFTGLAGTDERVKARDVEAERARKTGDVRSRKGVAALAARGRSPPPSIGFALEAGEPVAYFGLGLTADMGVFRGNVIVYYFFNTGGSDDGGLSSLCCIATKTLKKIDRAARRFAKKTSLPVNWADGVATACCGMGEFVSYNLGMCGWAITNSRAGSIHMKVMLCVCSDRVAGHRAGRMARFASDEKKTAVRLALSIMSCASAGWDCLPTALIGGIKTRQNTNEMKSEPEKHDNNLGGLAGQFNVHGAPAPKLKAFCWKISAPAKDTGHRKKFFVGLRSGTAISFSRKRKPHPKTGGRKLK